jgi:hypothetical protein
MKILKISLAPILFVLLSTSVMANGLLETPMDETTFVKTFAGKSADFVKENLGDPETISSKKNESGTVEFWLYKDIVKMDKKGKTFKYTQIGIINNYVETLGNTNRTPK